MALAFPRPARQRVAASSGFGSEARLIGYASGNFGKNLIFVGADVTFLYLLTDLFGLPGSVAGLLMLVAVVGDLVFDLLAALLVIRLRRAGKGYRWLILAGAIPAGGGFALLYALPALGAERVWMVAAALLLFRGAYAVIDVPHNALMARMTVDSRARGRVSGYRLFFSTTSGLTIAALLTPTVQHAVSARMLELLALTGCLAGVVFAMTIAFSALASGREVALPDEECRDGIAVPLRDGLVLGMGLIAAITGFAVPTFERMLLYMGTYVFHRPDSVSSLLVAVTCGQFFGVLFWTMLTGRYDKSRLLAAGHLLCAGSLGLFALCMASPPLLLASAVLVGAGFTCVFMLPWGLLADTVDFVAWRHGRRFETGLFAFYLVIVKAGAAAANATIGWSLGSLGYVPGAEQSALVCTGILVLGLGVPIAGSLGAFVLLRRFDIGHARHARVLAALSRRKHAKTAVVPFRPRSAEAPSRFRGRSRDWQDRAAKA